MKRILITPGEPAGIGPDITVQIAQRPWSAELVVVADPNLLLQRAQQLGLSLRLTECKAAVEMHEPGTLKIIPIPLKTAATPGKPHLVHAEYVIHTLQTAASLCLKQCAHAVVTGPVQKSTINAAGIAFTGHTEFFAQYGNNTHTVMLFVVDQLKVALVTTHLPLAAVPAAITHEHLRQTLLTLHTGLVQQFQIAAPRILVCGLNPHAGEEGYLGREEIDIITPVIHALRTQHYDVTGPLPADTIFTSHYLKQADAILAMYHDQALPLVKYLGFDHAVNVTLGLPFIRTSVDHGTALDIAGTGIANPGSMIAAVELAIKLQPFIAATAENLI